MFESLQHYLCWGLAEIIDKTEDCCYGCTSTCLRTEDPFPYHLYIASYLTRDSESTLTIDFNGSTPGDILGVNFFDKRLTREALKRKANEVFKRAHIDRYRPPSEFYSLYSIDSAEKSDLFYRNFRSAYEDFCRVKGWQT